MKYYLSFDCGTQSTKSAIYDGDFNCICQHSYPNEIKYPNPGWAEMDADMYLNHVVNGIKYCVEKSGINPNDIRAICGDGIIMGVVGVDEDGNAITPYIPYLDSRASEEAEYVKTLDPIWIEESGNSVIECLQPPIISMWLIKNNEEFKNRGAKILNNGPYVLSRLAGLKADEAFIDHATLGGWIIGYEAEKKKWSERQMEMLGIPMKYLPKIVKPTDIVGKLTAEMADRCGLVEGIPIIAGAGDTMQSFVGCGVYDHGTASDVAGTAAMFGIMVDGIHKELSENSGLYFSIATVPDTYFYWGYIRTGGLSLQWFRDQVMNRKGEDEFYQMANEKAEKVPVGSNGTLFFPYLQGGQGFVSNASGCFLNMTSNTELGEMWRSILESIGYEYMTLVKKIREAGVEVKEAVITEGGSRSDVWNQIKADMLDIDVRTMKKKEGATMSNAVLAAYAIGDIEDMKAKLDEILVPDKEFKPVPEHTEFYGITYDYYMNILKEHMSLAFKSCYDLRNVKCKKSGECNKENQGDAK
ncbi:MAG: FGGY family carbohydrate kinase [Tissierellia bacterium]|nr:FGGY family carbohydrate kinase [Tissierellia bacterium]